MVLLASLLWENKREEKLKKESTVSIWEYEKKWKMIGKIDTHFRTSVWNVGVLSKASREKLCFLSMFPEPNNQSKCPYPAPVLELGSLFKMMATHVFMVIAVVLAVYLMLSFSEIKCFIIVTVERKKKKKIEP